MPAAFPPISPQYVLSVNGVRPDESGDVILTFLYPEPTAPPVNNQKVLVLNPEEELPDLSKVRDGTLVVRLKSTPSTAVRSAVNIVLLDPLDPEPDATTQPKNTLVLRLLAGN